MPSLSDRALNAAWRELSSKTLLTSIVELSVSTGSSLSLVLRDEWRVGTGFRVIAFPGNRWAAATDLGDGRSSRAYFRAMALFSVLLRLGTRLTVEADGPPCTASRLCSRLPTLKMVFSVSLLSWVFNANRLVVMGNKPVCSRSLVSTSRGIDGMAALSVTWVAWTVGGP